MTAETSQPVEGSKKSFLGWRMVAIAFTSQNVCIAVTYGPIGILLAVMLEEFDTNRFILSNSAALVVVILGFMSPAAGRWIQKNGVRKAMLAGPFVLSATLFLLAISPNAYFYVIVYGVGLSVAMAMMGPLPSTAMVSNWFAKNQGRAMGIVMLPLIPTLMPPLTAYLLGVSNWRMTYVIMGVAVLALFPMMLLVVSKPQDVGQTPYGADDVDGVDDVDPDRGVLEVTSDAPELTWGLMDALRDPRFLFPILLGGVMTGGTIAMAVHFVPHVVSNGHSLKAAAYIATVHALAAGFGAMAYGFVADRLGGARSLVIVALALAASWTLMPVVSSYWGLMLLAVFSGSSMSGAFTVMITYFSQTFDQAAFARVSGLSTMARIPLNFAGAPIFGLMFDKTQSYQWAFWGYSIAITAMAGVLAFMIWKSDHHVFAHTRY